MFRLQEQTLPLGTFGRLGILVLAVFLVPLYWWLVPAKRRREFHIFASALVLIGFFPRQAPALFLAIGWAVYSVQRIRAIYEKAGKAVARAATGLDRRSPPARPVSNWIVLLHTLPLLAVFVCVKFSLIALIGYSYLLLKTLHLLIEAGRQRRFPGDTLDILHYLFFLPAFFSGPIDRLPRFRETAASRLSREDAIEGLYRFGFGMVRKFIFGDALYFLYQYLHKDLVRLNPGQTWLMYNLLFFYIYFDFAGYSDMAIGLGRLYGWRLCENFNFPYLARNISQFWRSWHMSLTFWLQDYIFTPVARWFTLRLKGKPQTRVTLAMGPAAALTMCACGIWHIIDFRMLLWGILEGGALFSGIVYGEAMKRANLGDFHKKLGEAIPYRTVCSILVIEFNCLIIPLLVEGFPTAWSAMLHMVGLTRAITG